MGYRAEAPPTDTHEDARGRVRGVGDTAEREHSDRGSGTLESTLTAVHPYVRYEASERLSVWGILGYGTGELTLDVDGKGSWTTDTTMEMAAARARGVLVPAAEAGDLELSLRTDAVLTRMRSEAVKSDAGKLEASEADTSRLRLMLEGSRAFELEGGGTLTPTLEAGLRHDEGDAETGSGVEVGGGLQYRDSATGLSAEAKVRRLVAHEDGDYREWGVSGSVRIEPDASGRGLSLTLTPAWGAAEGDAERLWSMRDARALAANDEYDSGGRLDAGDRLRVLRARRWGGGDPPCRVVACGPERNAAPRAAVAAGAGGRVEPGGRVCAREPGVPGGLRLPARVRAGLERRGDAARGRERRRARARRHAARGDALVIVRLTPPWMSEGIAVDAPMDCARAVAVSSSGTVAGAEPARRTGARRRIRTTAP